MTRAPVAAPRLVRVTVMAAESRVDLAVPASIPVAVLLPELARRVGLLDDLTTPATHLLVTQSGRALAPDVGLGDQEVIDGTVLSVVVADEARPPLYDDVVEAMTDVVESELRSPGPVTGRRTALGAAMLVLVLGAVALLAGPTAWAAPAAAGVGLCLAGAACLFSRVRSPSAAAVPVAWVGCAWTAVAGLLVAPPGGPALGLPLALAGAGTLTAGLVAVAGLAEDRLWLGPPFLVGAALVVTGSVTQLGGLPGAVVLATGLVLVTLAGSLLPGLALAATSTGADQFVTISDVTGTADPVDVRQVAADARTGHELLVAASASVGLLGVLATPAAVSLGLWGTLIAVACALVPVLRSRHHSVGLEVVLGQAAGVGSLVVAGVSVVVLHPDWRGTAAAVMALVGGSLLVGAAKPWAPSARRAWLADLVETTALASLPPLLVMATGAFEAVRGGA